MQNFRALGAKPPDPKTQPPPLRISGYAPAGMSTKLVPLGKRKAMLMFAMRQEDSYLCCDRMPTNRIKKTTVFERNFERQIMDKKNATRSESVLNQNTVKVYTDGSKLDERVGEEYPSNPQNRDFSTLEFTVLCYRQKS